ncbi:MAG: CrcB family protein [Cyanobacteriota bacterium]|nr:CrcB family protein [Cyanobacteriota bacterium]
MKPALRRELRDLALVAAGAIPGAWLRWRLQEINGGDRVGTVMANLLGCLLLGVVLARPIGSGRLALAVGIGFCGSLTTFSTLMLQLVQVARAGRADTAAGLLLASLVGGVALVALGHAIGAVLPAPQRRP